MAEIKKKKKEVQDAEDYIKAREKALSKGASKEEANRVGEASSKGTTRTVAEVQANQAKFIQDAGLAPNQQIQKPDSVETIISPPPEQLGLLGAAQQQAEKTSLFPPIVSQLTGLPQEGEVGIGTKAGIAASLATPLLWNVGGKVLAGTRAVQAGTAAKNTALAKPLLGKLSSFAIGAYATLKSAESVAAYFTGRKIDEQQQALNTLGQMATTIAGDSTEGAGDWRKGLQELNYIKQEIIRLEGAIKAHTIQSAAIKFNGKIYDINADIADQLATIDEQIRIIQTFALSGEMPELDPYEMQAYLRDLEEEGYIKPVDLTTSRRPTE